jgi:hypothetical protein
MMQQNLIFYPLLVMVALTFVTYVRLVLARTKAVNNKEISAKYFRLLQGGQQPDQVQALDRNVINLFELPVLFYAACVVAFVTQSVDGLTLALAWVFAASRVGHTVIHTGGNHVMHRLRIFVLGFVALLAMWVVLALRII